MKKMAVPGFKLGTCRLPTHVLNRWPILAVGDTGRRGGAEWIGAEPAAGFAAERQQEDGKRIRKKNKEEKEVGRKEKRKE